MKIDTQATVPWSQRSTQKPQDFNSSSGDSVKR